MLPLRVLETGWPSACIPLAVPSAADRQQRDCHQENQCAAVSSIFQLSTERGSGVKLYTFELQDYADGWTECEKHFGLFDVAGNDKCAACVSCAQPL